MNIDSICVGICWGWVLLVRGLVCRFEDLFISALLGGTPWGSGFGTLRLSCYGLQDRVCGSGKSSVNASYRREGSRRNLGFMHNPYLVPM